MLHGRVAYVHIVTMNYYCVIISIFVSKQYLGLKIIIITRNYTFTLYTLLVVFARSECHECKCHFVQTFKSFEYSLKYYNHKWPM